eukprot:gb/GECH01013009.1/.p1 GENE.gb/GECH01013009.1/~~gb/GECH01013009.1/.p1  ORF type:complete len:260 (+),score=21.31 gb/GECH01013009.1/:1-780(+)
MEALSSYISNFDTTPERIPFFYDYAYSLPLLTVVAYIALVFARGFIFPPTDSPPALRTPLRVWNLLMTLLSVVMLYGMGAPLLLDLVRYGFSGAVCANDNLWRGSRGFWLLVFAGSKYIELGDTVLLLLRRKPVSFLHWFHHASVLAYSWLALHIHGGAGVVFGAVNAFIHCIMYFYYFLTGFGIRPAWGRYLTLAQISQMFLGLLVTIAWLLLAAMDPPRYCGCSRPGVFAGASLFVYGAYAALFINLYVQRFKKKAQ